jgi:hypothetical protein
MVDNTPSARSLIESVIALKIPRQFKAIEKMVCYGWTPTFNEEISK